MKNSLLNEPHIRAFAPNAALYPIDLVESISSTNDYFKTQSLTSALHFCLAEHQTAGRGRFGRPFASPVAANIYLSCRWHFKKDLRQLAGLSLVISLSILKALHTLGISEVQIKWPNDVLWHHQKLSGVLIENTQKATGEIQVIIGIGLNVNMPEEIMEQIGRPVTSVQKILGSPQDRNQIAGVLIEQLITDLEIFAEKGFAAFKEAWIQADILQNQTITLLNGTQKIEGIVTGIDDQGCLSLKTGEITTAYSAGEVSIMRKD